METIKWLRFDNEPIRFVPLFLSFSLRRAPLDKSHIVMTIGLGFVCAFVLFAYCFHRWFIVESLLSIAPFERCSFFWSSFVCKEFFFVLVFFFWICHGIELHGQVQSNAPERGLRTHKYGDGERAINRGENLFCSVSNLIRILNVWLALQITQSKWLKGTFQKGFRILFFHACGAAHLVWWCDKETIFCDIHENYHQLSKWNRCECAISDSFALDDDKNRMYYTLVPNTRP